MVELSQAFTAVQRFVEQGGDVLYAIMVVLLLMWTLILERFWYYRVWYPRLKQQVVESWDARADTKSWHAKQIRTAMISQASMDLNQGIGMIKTLVALCPLLGLLGTVTGMIEVFDILAVTGSGNARAMASGVSKATLPTMSGMVAALSGLFFSVRLETYAKREAERLEDSLTQH